jgi:hypothetical protein
MPPGVAEIHPSGFAGADVREAIAKYLVAVAQENWIGS